MLTCAFILALMFTMSPHKLGTVVKSISAYEAGEVGYTENYLESRRIADLLNAKLYLYPTFNLGGCPLTLAVDIGTHFCYDWSKFNMPSVTEYKYGYLSAYLSDSGKVNYFISRFGSAKIGTTGYFVTALNPLQYERLKGHGVPEY